MRDSSLMALAVPSLDGDPDRLAPVLGLHDFLLQLVEPFTAIEHFADFSVLAYEDAALGVFGGVAGMDADALPLAVEIGATEQDGEPLLELRTPRDDHGIAAFGDGRAAFHLVGPVLVVAPCGFQRVAEITVFVAGQVFVHHLLADVQTSYRVGLALCNAFQY